MPAGTNRWRPASIRIPLFILSPRPLVIFVHKSAAVALRSHLFLNMALEECSLNHFTKCPQWRYRITPHEVTCTRHSFAAPSPFSRSRLFVVLIICSENAVHILSFAKAPSWRCYRMGFHFSTPFISDYHSEISTI